MPFVADLVDIATACTSRRLVNVLGVVVDKLNILQTRGSSFCITFEIKDDNFDGYAWQDSLKVKYFNDNESNLPDVLLNDVILLRDIRIKEYQGRPTAIVAQGQKVPWAIFRTDVDPSKGPSITTGPDVFTPTPMEKSRAVGLMDKVTPNPQPNMAGPSRRSALPQQPTTVVEASLPGKKTRYNTTSLIKDVEPDCFCRLVGQVLKDHHYEGDKSTIWISDYTENEELPDHEKDDGNTGTEGDTYGHLNNKKKWPGPWGKLTIQITLWDPHATFTRQNVKVGDIVQLSYVRPKISRNHKLEGVIHQDTKFPNKIHVRTVSPDFDKDAKELMNRRKEYWKVHGQKKEDSRPAKKQKKAQPQPKVQREEDSRPALPVTATSLRTKANSHVKTREYQIPQRSVDSILSAETHVISLPGGISYQVPFQNVCYRLFVRVVDFYPPNLEDFAVQVPSTSIVNQDDEYMTWAWRFCLLVEGVEPLMSKNQQRERLKIFVSGAEAEHLLCLDATDLRYDAQRLADLREKLSILWGDLEEAKSKESTAVEDQSWAPVKCSNLPFECSIKEFGIPCLHSRDSDAMAIDEELCVQEGCFGWERRFSLYATTIHD